VSIVAVPSVKLGVTVRPPDTALSSVTVNVIPAPSAAEASAMVNAGASSSLSSLLSLSSSSSTIVPVAVLVVNVTRCSFRGTMRTVNVSSGSGWSSSIVRIVHVTVSPALPAN